MTATNLLANQYTNEVYSALLYHAIGAWFEINNLDNLGAWFHHHADEELAHADKMYHHLLDRGLYPAFTPIPAIDPKGFGDGLGCFTAALAHEQRVTKWINDIAEAASKERDHVTYTFIQPFILEQVEEEDALSMYIGQINMSGNPPLALFMLNLEIEV